MDQASGRHRATQQRAIDRRRSLLRAARRLMIEDGMKAVTHRRVADAAGVPAGSVRYYFTTREELLFACIDDLEEDRAGEARSILSAAAGAGTTTPEELGLQVVRMIWGPDSSDSGLIGIVGATLDGVRESPTLSARMRHLREVMDDDLRQLVSAHGYRVEDMSLFTAVVNGSIVDCAAEGYDDVARRAAAGVAALLTRAHAPDPHDSH